MRLPRTMIFQCIVDYINENMANGIDYNETIDSFIEQLNELRKEYEEEKNG